MSLFPSAQINVQIKTQRNTPTRKKQSLPLFGKKPEFFEAQRQREESKPLFEDKEFKKLIKKLDTKKLNHYIETTPGLETVEFVKDAPTTTSIQEGVAVTTLMTAGTITAGILGAAVGIPFLIPGLAVLGGLTLIPGGETALKVSRNKKLTDPYLSELEAKVKQMLIKGQLTPDGLRKLKK